jgi:putative membrane protein
MGMMSGMGSMMGSGWMAVTMLVDVLLGLGLLALVVVGVVAGIRWMTRSTDHPRGAAAAGRALEVARERYARGEISREEFARIREDLA